MREKCSPLWRFKRFQQRHPQIGAVEQLFEAIDFEDLDIVMRLLKNGVELDRQNEWHSSTWEVSGGIKISLGPF